MKPLILASKSILHHFQSDLPGDAFFYLRGSLREEFLLDLLEEIRFLAFHSGYRSGGGQ